MEKNRIDKNLICGNIGRKEFILEKFVRFEISGEKHYGRLDGSVIESLDGPYWIGGQPTGTVARLDDVKLLCPVEPTKIICVGLNYHMHVQHSQSATKVPENPVLFMKPPSSLLEPEGKIVYPDNCDRVDYEAELAVVMGKRGHKISQEDATDYIFGYTCLNDVTARKIQKGDGQWTRGKGFDTFCPVGPHVVSDVDVSDLSVEAYLNEEQKQFGRTSDMIFSIPYLIQFISAVMTLMPGDIISTGTPQGIDPMQRGDKIEVRIQNIGSLFNTVV
jgi:2-keto-4-pentenoate hydratase/2-oxohepta-3-ene-1,7-dioic acid hydratase in catechol pathway